MFSDQLSLSLRLDIVVKHFISTVYASIYTLTVLTNVVLMRGARIQRATARGLIALLLTCVLAQNAWGAITVTDDMSVAPSSSTCTLNQAIAAANAPNLNGGLTAATIFS